MLEFNFWVRGVSLTIKLCVCISLTCSYLHAPRFGCLVTTEDRLKTCWLTHSLQNPHTLSERPAKYSNWLTPLFYSMIQSAPCIACSPLRRYELHALHRLVWTRVSLTFLIMADCCRFDKKLCLRISFFKLVLS